MPTGFTRTNSCQLIRVIDHHSRLKVANHLTGTLAPSCVPSYEGSGLGEKSYEMLSIVSGRQEPCIVQVDCERNFFRTLSPTLYPLNSEKIESDLSDCNYDCNSNSNSEESSINIQYRVSLKLVSVCYCAIR